MANFQALNRGEIRRTAGRYAGMVIIGTAKSTTDTSSLIDTYGLRGGDDEHNGKEVLIYDATGAIVDGEKSRVTDYAGSTSDATVSPVFTAAITSGDKYEMWPDGLDIDEVNDLINEQVSLVSPACPVAKVTRETFTESKRYQYSIPSGFIALSRVDYARSSGDIEITDCDTIWTAGTVNTTAVLDTVTEKEGTGCAQLTVGAGASAGDLLGYYDFTALDLSDCTHIELWVRPAVACAAGNLQLVLDNTAGCASPLETIDFPALTAVVWQRVSLPLVGPKADGAIVSVGVKMAVDKGAFNLWLDDIVGADDNIREYRELPATCWGIVKGTTPYLALTALGLSITGEANTLLRLTGYRIPAMFADDTTDSEVNPAYLTRVVAGDLLMNHYKGTQLDTDARKERAQKLLAEAGEIRRGMTVSYMPNTRFI